MFARYFECYTIILGGGVFCGHAVWCGTESFVKNASRLEDKQYQTNLNILSLLHNIEVSFAWIKE